MDADPKWDTIDLIYALHKLGFNQVTLAEYIKQRIGERINRSSITVVYLSQNTAQSQWVAWEVQRSLELGKKVIAVHAGDSYNGQKPSWIGGNKIKVVPWAQLAGNLK